MARNTLEASSSSFFLFFFFLHTIAESREILIGGKPNAWQIPSPPDSLNKWAKRTPFHIGDTLVWQYDGNKDAVLQVTKEAYLSCNSTDPVAEYKDGHTTVKLDKRGPLFFISGSKSNCEEGQKLIVMVTPQRHHGFTDTSPAIAPSLAESRQPPAVAPTSTAVSTSSLQGRVAVALLATVGFGLVFL